MSLLSRKDTEVIRVIPYDVSWAFMGIAGPDPKKRRESSAPPLRAASIEGVAKGPSPAKMLLKNQQLRLRKCQVHVIISPVSNLKTCVPAMACNCKTGKSQTTHVYTVYAVVTMHVLPTNHRQWLRSTVG